MYKKYLYTCTGIMYREVVYVLCMYYVCMHYSLKNVQKGENLLIGG